MSLGEREREIKSEGLSTQSMLCTERERERRAILLNLLSASVRPSFQKGRERRRDKGPFSIRREREREREQQ